MEPANRAKSVWNHGICHDCLGAWYHCILRPKFPLASAYMSFKTCRCRHELGPFVRPPYLRVSDDSGFIIHHLFENMPLLWDIFDLSPGGPHASDYSICKPKTAVLPRLHGAADMNAQCALRSAEQFVTCLHCLPYHSIYTRAKEVQLSPDPKSTLQSLPSVAGTILREYDTCVKSVVYGTLAVLSIT
ncbi:uncharacterized protein BT62DRAFT_615622 [Guyanagaster necrorhizus]|uniref:Uncharacterized protein n=1 Tax=Guyanagaster necrorhizus TaxID=856835 RepID=A0A9P7W036_9AGAR|nr:uncharacterized protein BT62DRAFT_615622 [Guyanagaster necrorhizus MCA 3950]KAG7449920.1 hypothetical protein BT62DRAFT_615622 [Guyanagaster necrorhizus MCA 3950]